MTQPIGGGTPAVETDNKPHPGGDRSVGQAVWALILGIVGIVCCGLAAPVAWYLGRAEIKAVDAGLSAPGNRGMAMAGMILGIIGTVLLILGLIWIFFAGGMAVLSGMQHGWQ